MNAQLTDIMERKQGKILRVLMREGSKRGWFGVGDIEGLFG